MEKLKLEKNFAKLTTALKASWSFIFSHTYDYLQQFKNSTWLLLAGRPFNKAFATDISKDFLH